MNDTVAKQLQSLSEKYAAAAASITDYIMDHNLPEGDLDKKVKELLAASTHLTEASAIANGEKVAASITKLDKITSDIQTTIQKISDIQKLANIATDMLKVAASLIKFNADDIIAAVSDLAKNIDGL